MTDKIKSAVEVVNKYLNWSVMGRSFVSEEQIELEKSLIFLRDYAEKTSKAWDEVIAQLTVKRDYYEKKNHTLFAEISANINLIESLLAYIEEVN